MTESTPVSPRIALISCSLFCLVLLTPLAWANSRLGVIEGVLVLLVLFFLPGYVFLTLLRTPAGGLRILLSFVFGLVVITTFYNLCVGTPVERFFFYFIVILSCAGTTLLLLRLRWASNTGAWTLVDYETVIAGVLTTLIVAPLDWRSGRFSDGNFVFYGPAGEDPLFHVSLLQRLLHHVPPDNFIMSGLRAPVYHYLDDLALALILNAQKAFHLGSTDLYDLYYRCYPTIIYFLLGALAYRVGRQLLGKISGGILGVLLLLGAGGLGFVSGLLQTAVHVFHPSVMRALFFSDWTGHNGVDPIFPLVHRPAHYHSLLIGLAVINLLLRPVRRRRDWIIAGLMLGLMAGFNFTLAAIFGVSSVLAGILLWLWGARSEARDLAWLALMTLVGSLPIAATIALSGFHNQAPGFPFRGPNLEFPTAISHGTLRHFMPAILVPVAALIFFPIRAYGVRLAGCRNMLRLDIGGIGNRAIAAVLSITFAVSFIIGTFFPYKAQGGIAIVFIQPTLWMMALFSLVPIAEWMHRNQRNWRPILLWGVLVLTWVEALGAFNFGRKAAFSRDAAAVFREIRATSAPDDVVAYLPSNLTEKPVWGHPSDSTNFSITALTGLDGYVSSESYSTAFAVPSLQGRSDEEILNKADRLYEQRRDDLESFINGNANDAVLTRLVRDHVRWIVVSGDMAHDVSAPNPWRRTSDLVVYKLQ